MTEMTSYEKESERLLSELEQDREKLEKRAKIAQENLDAMNRKIATLKESLSIYRIHHNLPQPIEQDVKTSAAALMGKLTNLSTKQILIRLAQEREGVLRVAEVSRTLTEVGYFKDLNNARGNVYVTIRRNPALFRKIDKGTYRLVQHAEVLTPEPETTTNGKR